MKITDDQVADLPLSAGRAELLEEIMRTPVLDDRPVQTPTTTRRHRWLVPIAAAAAVALLAGGVAWRLQGTDPAPQEKAPVATQPGAAAEQFIVVDAPGWTATSAYVDGTDGETEWSNGQQELEINWYPADTYDGYVEDRRHITDPPSDGTPVEVLGRDGQMWAYSAQDHTTIRAVEGDRWFELRGSGMDETTYVALLGQLASTDRAGFEAALPDDFVDTTESSATIEQLLGEIHLYVDPLFPPASGRTGVSSTQTDPYHLGADVAGAVACSWLDEFKAAKEAGDQARMQRAADALATSRQWPVLQRMNAQGDYPEAIWDYADQVAAGEVPEGYAGGLGCEG